MPSAAAPDAPEDGAADEAPDEPAALEDPDAWLLAGGALLLEPPAAELAGVLPDVCELLWPA